VTVKRYELQEVVIDVDTPGPGLVRLADQWYPDWKATVDGSPVEVLRADYALRAVPVPAGSTKSCSVSSRRRCATASR